MKKRLAHTHTALMSYARPLLRTLYDNLLYLIPLLEAVAFSRRSVSSRVYS